MRRFMLLCGLLAILAGAMAGRVLAGPYEDALTQLGQAKTFPATETALAALIAAKDPRALDALEAIEAGTLHVRKADRIPVLLRAGKLIDAASGTDLGPEEPGALEKIRVNNRIRTTLAAALGALRLSHPDKAKRLAAADSVRKARDAAILPVLDAARASEQDAEIRTALTIARAEILLSAADAPVDQRLSAITDLGRSGGRNALPVLRGVVEGGDAQLAAAAKTTIAEIERSLAFWDGVQNLVFGLSLGSVLLLAAIGLAVTFGVMGVINMAHGEMVMLGAYTVFVIQQIFPGPYALLLAIPAAFLVSGAVGVAIERGIIRHLYGRPLETLLATFGLSLILQQAVRSLYGPTNREVSSPAWMGGVTQIGEMAITNNRLIIFAFAMTVFVALLLAIRYSRFGLYLRAVTQNRRMAASMGIRTGWVDAFTFGLGSGIAGIAGVALSQIDNVSPNLGQAYIIDSFMVVVFGGVGNLWGTLIAALSLGIANKLLEPLAGAVLGKIAVLVLIILFIQKRPRGLFALKGRAVEQ